MSAFNLLLPRLVLGLLAMAGLLFTIPRPALAQSSGHAGAATYFIFIAIVIAIYLAPTIVAFRRRHPNRWFIGALNLALGATGIVWLGCLVWAFGAVYRSDETDGSDEGESGGELFVNDAQRGEVHGASPPTASAGELEKLERLKQLLDSEAITRDEFERLKAKVLATG